MPSLTSLYNKNNFFNRWNWLVFYLPQTKSQSLISQYCLFTRKTAPKKQYYELAQKIWHPFQTTLCHLSSDGCSEKVFVSKPSETDHDWKTTNECVTKLPCSTLSSWLKYVFSFLRKQGKQKDPRHSKEGF